MVEAQKRAGGRCVVYYDFPGLGAGLGGSSLVVVDSEESGARDLGRGSQLGGASAAHEQWRRGEK